MNTRYITISIVDEVCHALQMRRHPQTVANLIAVSLASSSMSSVWCTSMPVSVYGSCEATDPRGGGAYGGVRGAYGEYAGGSDLGSYGVYGGSGPVLESAALAGSDADAIVPDVVEQVRKTPAWSGIEAEVPTGYRPRPPRAVMLEASKSRKDRRSEKHFKKHSKKRSETVVVYTSNARPMRHSLIGGTVATAISCLALVVGI